MPNPNIDFFSGEPESGAGSNGNDKPMDDAFAGMQELNLFDDAPEAETTSTSDATQVFDVKQPVAAKPAAPSVPQDKEKEKNIGEMVFQSLFAEEESNQPVAEDAIPLDFAQPAENVPSAQAADEAEPISVEMPHTAAPAKPTGSLPVFNSTNRQEPLRRQVKAKPIDWNVDHFRQAKAQPVVVDQPAPVEPVQQPAMTSAPIEPIPAQPVQQQAEPEWKQLLDQAISDQKDVPSQAGEEATRVFEPAAPVQPMSFEPAELHKTTAFDFDAQPPMPEKTPEPEVQQPVSQTIPLDFSQPEPEPAVEELSFDMPLEPVQPEEPKSGDLGGIAPIDFSAFDQAVSQASEESYGEPAPSDVKDDLFAGLYDADPDEDEYEDTEDDEEDMPRRGRKGGSGGGRKGGSKMPLIIGIALVILVLVVLLVTKLLGSGDDKGNSTSQATSSSMASSSVPDASSASSVVTEPVDTIPRDEWYMRLVNRSNVLSKEEADAITTADVGGVPVDSRAADAFNQLLSAAKDAGYTLTLKVGYRTYDTQATNYNAGYTDCPAGASEHNLGLSADIFSSSVSGYDDAAYRASAEYQWLTENAANYGFIERYPEGTKEITGFDPEPWHWRYVGVEQAQKIKASGLTLEQYLAQDSTAPASSDASSAA